MSITLDMKNWRTVFFHIHDYNTQDNLWKKIPETIKHDTEAVAKRFFV